MTTKYSIAAAHRITGKSRTTIAKHLRQGKLSYELDPSGAKLIDGAELARVYGDECDFSAEEGAETPAAGRPAKSDQGVQRVQPEVNTLRDRLESEVAERQRERAHYREQIEHLQDALKRAQEGQNKAMLLLESRSGRGEIDATLRELEERIERQQQETRREIADAVKMARSEGVRRAKDLPWWRLLGA
ncbi:hypothetical protein [Botrimarina mediterranea]|uniref:hypothetical protein n=1 Tax=Botrimarina mediterranea TaxID=2528022 RepID=UPI00118BBB0E|nr:hypothetical protein K2D_26970 [Planctomycetes bacterium K2D]